jgi:hypothetical protein
MGFLDRKPEPANADPDARIAAARDAFEDAAGQFPPSTLAVLVAGAKEILRLPPPWSAADRAIVRHVDSAFGGRQLWLAGTQSWEDRVDASDSDRARIAELEADAAAKLEAMDVRRMEYLGFEIERRRRQAVLGRAPYDHDRGGVILPKGVDPSTLTAEAFAQIERDYLRAEQKYLSALEEYQLAKGQLSEFKQRVQEMFFHRELLRSQRAARAEQESRGVRWGVQE